MKKRTVIATLLVAVVLSTPWFANAQTADQLRSQIADILAQIYTLRAQLQGDSVPASAAPITPQVNGIPITPTAASATGFATFQYSRCPNLQYDLELGDTDANVAEEVGMLQRFLQQDPRLYPEGLVTGYYGPATERAVQRFQDRHGIISYGDRAATGYGRVGPRTRHAIKNSCGAAGTHSFAVSPVAGYAPLTASGTFEFKGSSCTSYQLDWGDGSTPVTHQAQSTTNCTNDTVRKQATHSYTTPGTYVVTLRVGKGSVYTLPIVGRTNVVVQGIGTASSHATLRVSTANGYAPLEVEATLLSDTSASCTSFEIDWGDGSVPLRQEASSFACTSLASFARQFSHTYQNAGIYTIRARAGRGAVAELSLIEQRITVNQGGGTTTSSCFIEPNTGQAPLASRARILFGGTLCDGTLTYNLDWGDGTVSETRSCSDQNSHYEQFTHTYTTAGTYTARLQQAHPNARFTEQSCEVVVKNPTPTTSGVAISNSCRSWTDGCNTCSRSYAGGPAACTQQYCILYGTQQCYQYFGTTNNPGTTVNQDTLSHRLTNTSSRTVEFTAYINAARGCNGGVYSIYFGDTQESIQPFPADACQLFTRVVSHTYAANGTYTALLVKNGVVVDQAIVVVSGTSKRIGSNMAAAIAAIERIIGVLFK